MPLPSNNRNRTLTAIAIVVFILIVDQIIKVAGKTNMALGEEMEVTDWCRICFTENKGMAFGVEYVGTMVLSLFRIVAVAFFTYALFNIIRKRAPWGLLVSWAAVVAGAAGNIIDNFFYGLIFSESGRSLDQVAHFTAFGEGYGGFLTGRVVDMFYFPLFTWPDWMPLLGGNVFFGAVFNFADAAISCGGIALVFFFRHFLSIDYLFKRA